jgi:Tfp pilus assembly protein PilZ
MEKNIGENEKRRDLRVKIDSFQMKCQIIKKDGLFPLQLKKTSLVRVRNVSVDGVFVELPLLKQGQLEDLSKGGYELVLELKTSDDRKPIKIKGKLAWIRKKDDSGKSINVAGVHFHNLDDKTRKEILDQLIDVCLRCDDCLQE